MALSAAAHHSFDKVAAGEKFTALRGQNTEKASKEVEERELHHAPRRQKPPPPGTRPAPLVEMRPQAGIRRHMLELFSSKVSVDQDLSVIVAEIVNDDDVKQRLVPIVFHASVTEHVAQVRGHESRAPMYTKEQQCAQHHILPTMFACRPKGEDTTVEFSTRNKDTRKHGRHKEYKQFQNTHLVHSRRT